MLAGGLEALAELGVRLVAFAAAGLDGDKHPFDHVDGFQNQADELGSQRPLAIAQLTEDVFGQVGDRFQGGKTEKAASPFDGVDGAENASQEMRVARVLFELHHLLIEPGQALVTLNQEFSNDVAVIHSAHDCRL